MLAPSPCSGRRFALLNQPRTFEEERDRVQHHVVASLAVLSDPRLVFEGGTMLRVCGLPNYRYSEYLDFDWVGSPPGVPHPVDLEGYRYLAWNT